MDNKKINGWRPLRNGKINGWRPIGNSKISGVRPIGRRLTSGKKFRRICRVFLANLAGAAF